MADTPAAPKRKPIWKREKVWGVLITIAVPILNRKLDLGLTILDVGLIMGSILTLVGIEGVADWIKVNQESKARARGGKTS